MGLAADLTYEIKPASRTQLAIQKVGSTRLGAWLLSKTFFVADKALFRITAGRQTLPSLLAGLPVLMLTTTGARSGEKRITPLIGIPLDGELAVLGTNYGLKPTHGRLLREARHPRIRPLGARSGTVARTEPRASASPSSSEQAEPSSSTERPHQPPPPGS